MKQLTYLFIQLWAPRSECEDPERPHYVMSFRRNEALQWTLTREFTEAHNFQRRKTAERVVRCVKRFAERVARGWLYEIIQVEETIVDTNVPEAESEAA